MPAPHQITAFPLTIYVAPTGEAMPNVDEAPAGNWLKLGTAGAKDYAEEGVTVTHSQTIETFTGAESTAPRKAFRTEEGLVLAFTLSDLSPEQFATILDDASVTTTAAEITDAKSAINEIAMTSSTSVKPPSRSVVSGFISRAPLVR